MDTEIFGQLIASSKAGNLEQAVLEAAQKIPVAYSLLVFSEKQIFALRDRFGVRPLSFGKLDKGYLICSENYALDQYLQIRDVQEVKPGEMLIFDTQSPRLQRKQYAETNEHFCIFEAIYFSDPRSRYNGIWHEDFRHALGVKLYEENPDLQGDFIVPVLETGKHAAIGLSEYSGIPYKEYFKRQRNRSRTNRRSFTSASQEERVRTARQKQHLRKEKVKGKHIVIVDDTIVRSTTIRLINRRLREAGVASITNCISAPPITDVCLYGIDIQDKEQLVAYKYKSIDEIAKEVDADRMIYLSLEGLNQVVAQTYRCGICSACFGGRKPKVCAQEPLKDV